MFRRRGERSVLNTRLHIKISGYLDYRDVTTRRLIAIWCSASSWPASAGCELAGSGRSSSVVLPCRDCSSRRSKVLTFETSKPRGFYVVLAGLPKVGVTCKYLQEGHSVPPIRTARHSGTMTISSGRGSRRRLVGDSPIA